MKTRHDIVWDNATLQGASAPLTQKVFGNSVCGVRIQNRSVWVLMVTETATGAPVEELPPFSWVLIPNPVDYTFNLLVASNNLTKPADMRVSVTYVDTPVSYAYGTISTQNGQSNPYVTGEVGLSAGTTVSLPAGTSVTLADGSTVALASGTAVDLASGATVGIDSSANTIQLASGGAVGLSSGSSLQSILDAIQTNSLVFLGSLSIPVSDLANGESVSKTLTGTPTGYYETLVLAGTSEGGYTYTSTATPYNRSVALTAPTLSQTNGSSGQFYAEGTTSSRQSFGNVEVSLQAYVTSASTIFSDPMTSGTDWTTQAGSVAYSSAGATFGTTPTTLLENTLTGLEPQNLTLQADFSITNTQTVVNYVIPASPNTSVNWANNYYQWSIFEVSQACNLVGWWVSGGSSSSSGTVTAYIWDSSGNVLASGSATLNATSWVSVNWSGSIPLLPSTEYFFGWMPTSVNTGIAGLNQTSVTFSNTVSVTFGNGTYYSSGPPSSSSTYESSTVLVFEPELQVITGSHSTIGVEYQKSSDTYYEVQWDSTSLSLIKDDAGTVSTLATTSVTNETDTSVTLSLVVANNGNLTGTLKGAATNTVTATDIAITSGQMAVTGDSDVVASNAVITGNYVPSDTVTVGVYAT